MSGLILLSALLLLPALLPTVSNRFVTVVPVMIPAVRYCRSVECIDLEFGSPRCFSRLGNQLDALHGLRRQYLNYLLSGLRYYLFQSVPIRSAISLVNTLLLVDASLPRRSMLHLILVAIDPAWCGNSSTLMTSFFLSLPPSKTLLSFLLLLIQLSFFVVLLLCFDPCPYGLLLYHSCALSSSILILLSSCIMLTYKKASRFV